MADYARTAEAASRYIRLISAPEASSKAHDAIPGLADTRVNHMRSIQVNLSVSALAFLSMKEG
jgi:hypothetical protein